MDVLFAPLRFCVPVFLTISFLLLKRSLDNYSTASVYSLLKKRFIRLLIPTLFWCTLAAGLRFLGKANSTEPLFVPLLQGRIFPGAYYLLIMLQFLPVFIGLQSRFIEIKNVLITVLLQVLVFMLVYLAIQGEFDLKISMILREIARPFFIYWFAYMALGAYFYNNWFKVIELSQRIPLISKILLLTLTSLIMIAEYSNLRWVAGGQASPFEYAMFSCLLSVLVIFLCFASLKENQIPVPLRKVIQLLSRYSLGIFCINGILSLIFFQLSSRLFIGDNFNLPEVLAIKFFGWSLLLTVSLALSILLDRIGLGPCVR
jgi:hypothetical protein